MKCILGRKKLLKQTKPTVFFKSREIHDSFLKKINIESKYKGYFDRQKEDIKNFKKDEGLFLSSNLNYSKIPSLSNEVVEKLSLIQPKTLGAASRISGITPAAVVALLRYVKKDKNTKAA